MTAKETLESVAAELGLTMSAKFVPWSMSRNAGEKQPSLNWIITIQKDGHDVLTTDYMAGCGHAPSYKQRDNTFDRSDMVRRECETGTSWKGRKRILPDLADVLYSLSSDASAIDSPNFESWAFDLGYDTDSRKAEGIYRACMEIATKLRAAIGEEGLQKLREACQDY